MKLDARTAVGLVLVGGFLFMLGVGLPGHLSFDSIAQLHEGHLHVRETWGPAVYAWLLGFFDSVIPGAGLYVVASALLLFFSLISLRDLRPATSWLAPFVALAIVASPMVLIYQAIVWKDVLFANCAIAGCVALAHADRRWDRRGLRALLLAAVVVLLAVAGLVRQNGLLVAVCAALAIACVARTPSLLVRIAWGIGLFVAILAANLAIAAASVPKAAGPDIAVDTGVRILQHYDLVGAAAKDPGFVMPAMERSAPGSTRIIRSRAAAAYSAQRVDFVARDQPLNDALWLSPAEAVKADWLNLVLHRPGLYLRTRADVFHWLVAPPAIDRCLPVFVGVDGAPAKMANLRLPHRLSLADREMYDYVAKLSRTPFYSHVTYGVLAFAVGVFLLIRRERADLPMAALMAGALGFAASFLVISIACDYRYLYFLDLAAMTGVLYLALDPRLKRRPA